MRALTSFFVDGAVWFFKEVLRLITTVTSPDLTAQGFKETYAQNFAIAPWVMLIMCFITVGNAALHRDGDTIGQMMLAIFPAVLFTLASPAVLQLCVGIVDWGSAAVTQNTGDEIAQFIKGMTNFWNMATPTTPMFPLVLSAVLGLIGAIGIWLDLIVRTALIYLGAAFLPLAWAAIVNPRARGWVRKLGWALVAIIASKFFVVGAFSLAAKLLTNGGGTGTSANQSVSQNFQGVFIGGGMMLAAAFMPIALYRIVTAFDQAYIQHRGMVAAAAHSLPGYATGAALVKQNLSMSRMMNGSRSGGAAASRPSANGGKATTATSPASAAAGRAAAGGTTAATAAGGAATAGTALLVRAGEGAVDQVGERLASTHAAATEAANASTQTAAASDTSTQMAYGDSGGRQWLRVVDHQASAIYYVNQADPNSPEYTTPNDTYERPHPRWRADDQSWYRGSYEQ
jgi:hypothetical protein